MKIFVDTTPLRYTFSGIQVFTFNLIREFKKLGEEVIEIKKPFIKLLFSKGDVYLGPDGRIPPLKKFKIISTIIHDVCFENDPLLFPPKGVKLAREKVKRALFNSDIIFVPSKFTKETIKKFYGFEEKLFVLYPGVNIPQKLVKVENIPEKFFLFVGTVQKRKNLLNLIEAFKELSLKDYYLLIAGERGFGFEEVERLIGGNIIWLRKSFTHEEIFYLYEKSVALIYPSFCEGFGLPVLEAMILKKPVIASPLSVFKEFAQDSIFYMKGFDKNSIREGIINFFQESEENIKNKILRAYKIAKNFTWEKTGLKILKKWKEMIL